MWTFEQLEERHYLSATPIYYEPGLDGTLTDDQVTFTELYWAVKQAGQLGQYDADQLASNTQWAVLTSGPLAATGAFADETDVADLYYVDSTGLTLDQVVSSLSSSENVLGFYPLLSKTQDVSTYSPLDEPLFPYQWHLQNTGGVNIGNPDYQVIYGVAGEDANVVPAWNLGYTGDGVTVAVVDTGVQTAHPDLFANINSVLGYDFIDGDFDPNPETTAAADAHGTAVAGLIAADGGNGYGGTGVAPDANIVGLRVLSEDPFVFDYLGIDSQEANVFAYGNDDIDIYNHSWGPTDATRASVGPGPLTLLAIRESVRFGRDNLGNIHVFAAGNGAGFNFPPAFGGGGSWDSANFNGYASSRYTIGVGGIDHDGTIQNVDGTFTSYPETGAAVLVVAPTGSVSLDVGIDTGTGSGIFTTDETGDNGFNSGPDASGFEADRDFLENTDFTSRFNGTSASTPIVSGVVALMLEANPNLNYRDVQEILLRSARQPDPTHEGWETNYMEVFQDPAELLGIPVEDPYFRLEDAVFPVSLVAGATGLNYSPTFVSFFSPKAIDDYTIWNKTKTTNGAGYSIDYAKGIYSEETGYAHGVVDAELAVQLASQWTDTNQNLSPELTYTSFVRQPGASAGTIGAAGFVGPDGADDFFVIPGTIQGNIANPRDFERYYDEFWNTQPAFANPTGTLPVNNRGINFGGSTLGALPFREPNLLEGFTPPLMDVEWVEVKVEVYGSGTDLNELRFAIQSPDGTISDLSDFLEANTSWNMNYIDQDNLRIAPPTSPGDGNSGPFIWTFATNRHWGERSDDYTEVDPTTGQYRQDPDLKITLNTTTKTYSTDINHNWELIVENYAGSSFTLDTFEIVLHGTPLIAGSERIQGKIGVDENGDGDFNFLREVQADIDGDTFITPADYDITGDGIPDIGELDRDANPEEFASNLVVQALDHNTQNVVDEFLVGADGNYYFDLPPGTYDVRVSPDSLAAANLTAKQDTTQGVTALDPRYLQTWTVTVDPTDNFTRVAGRKQTVDDNRDAVQDFVDQNGNQILDPGESLTYRYLEYNDVNFLLDPGPQPAQQIDVSGLVYVDFAGDGVLNNNDTGAENFTVYADLNNSGSFEIGEPADFVSAGDDGNFSLVIPLTTSDPQSVTIVAETDLTGWTTTLPVNGRTTVYGGPGDVFDNLQFGFRPPPGSENPPDNPPPGSDTGVILGIVYQDVDGDGVRDGSEEGISGIQVYVDVDQNGLYDAGEPTDLTDANGAYFLSDVDPGSLRVRIVAPASWQLTSPVAGYRSVTLGSSSTVTNVLFGLKNLATRDFGDLPGPYPTLEADNGPRHTFVPGFSLGNAVDGEVDGQPTANADGDDLVSGDEGLTSAGGGIKLPNGPLVPGVANTIRVTVQGVGGVLNGWIDWDDDGAWQPDEQVFDDVDLDAGTYDLTVTPTADMVEGPLAARFRWGQVGLSFVGPAGTGEVEDYFLPTVDPSTSTIVEGDFDGSGLVDDSDYEMWKANFGLSVTPGTNGDGNGDGWVDSADYSMWRDHLGEVTATGSTSLVTYADSPTSSTGAVASTSFADYTQRQISPEMLAQLIPLGLRERTFVGADGTTQTLYYFVNVSDDTTDSQSSDNVETTADVPLLSIALSDVQYADAGTTAQAALLVDQPVSSDSTTATADLQLLDAVLTQMAPQNDDSQAESSLVIGQGDDQNGDATDAALVAVLEDEAPWWLGV